jgi:threonylcarbamoyladenosine tRNA methylthiotransferase MtaB
MKVSFKTLGCRLNQHETDALVSTFDREGFEIVDFKESSDITVINTCTVTSQSDHKSRNIIQQAIKLLYLLHYSSGSGTRCQSPGK